MSIRHFSFTFLVVVVFLSTEVSIGDNVANLLSQCCNVGVTWANNNQPCDGHPTPIPRIERQHQAICMSTLSICCLRTYRSRMCAAGIESAKISPRCLSITKIGGEYHKDCCDACKLGIAIRGQNDTSSCKITSFEFGSPWEDAFQRCCLSGFNGTANENGGVGGSLNTVFKRNTTTTVTVDTHSVYNTLHYPRPLPVESNVNALDNGQYGTAAGTSLSEIGECSRFPKGQLCDHECVDTPQGYYCECRPGHRLNADGKSCTLGTDRCSLSNPCDHLCKDTGDAVLCSCRPGYQLKNDGRNCEDIDECFRETDDCDRITERCVNTVGGYSCSSRLDGGSDSVSSDYRSGNEGISDAPQLPCPLGYEFSQRHNSCQDSDECALGTDVCEHGSQFCTNTIGSYVCVTKQSSAPCPPGYKYNDATSLCTDVDECAEGLDACNRQREFCLNLVGTYECQPKTGSTCPAGYKYNALLQTCEDVNECQVGSHSCLSTQRCDNTIGSFTCIRLTGCGTGYTLNAHSSHCEDDDECQLGTHNCGPAYQCRNTLGSFRCDRKVCPTGHQLVADGSCIHIDCGDGFQPDASGQCVDVNECDAPNICRTNQRCINVVGSYNCQNLINCGGGYELDQLGSRCIDIDECSSGTHDCRGNQHCINRQGGYICQCPSGFSLNSLNGCEDLDECVRYHGKACSSNSVCRNTPGSFVCDCNEGFQHGENNRTCIDVDECQQFGTICQHTCINTWGSYQCTCLPGYTQGTDKRTCNDVDECELYKGRGNLCVGICVNEPGSFSCSCPPGYKLSADKRTCQDVDECQQDFVCKGEDQTCLNTRGSYKCNTLNCPPNYIRDVNHKNRCKRESTVCRHDDEDCIKQPLSYSFNYLTFVSRLPIPPAGHVNLFTMRGPPFSDLTSEFSLELLDARAPLGIVTANRDYFQLRRTSFNQAVISLVKTIDGPQEIELNLTMNLYRGSVLGGTALAKIFIYVSEYEF